MRYREFRKIARKLSSVLRKDKGVNVYLSDDMISDKTVRIEVRVSRVGVYRHKDGRRVKYVLWIDEVYDDER